MVPQSLSDWTLTSLRGLLDAKYREVESFDYKTWKVTKKSPQEKDHIRTDCCAFANAQGGFLVYGVRDDIQLSTDDRLEGLDATLDFPIAFGDFPATCTPSIYWIPLNPPIRLPNGRAIQVIHIPRSFRGPHTFDQPNGFRFPKRTNKGNEYMVYDEVRNSFAGQYEKRLKLMMLSEEMREIIHIAKQVDIRQSRDERERIEFAKFAMRVLEAAYAEAFILLADNQRLLEHLRCFRRHCRAVNAEIDKFNHAAVKTGEARFSHNRFLGSACRAVLDEGEKCQALLSQYI